MASVTPDVSYQQLDQVRSIVQVVSWARIRPNQYKMQMAFPHNWEQQKCHLFGNTDFRKMIGHLARMNIDAFYIVQDFLYQRGKLDEHFHVLERETEHLSPLFPYLFRLEKVKTHNPTSFEQAQYYLRYGRAPYISPQTTYYLYYGMEQTIRFPEMNMLHGARVNSRDVTVNAGLSRQYVTFFRNIDKLFSSQCFRDKMGFQNYEYIPVVKYFASTRDNYVRLCCKEVVLPSGEFLFGNNVTPRTRTVSYNLDYPDLTYESLILAPFERWFVADVKMKLWAAKNRYSVAFIAKCNIVID